MVWVTEAGDVCCQERLTTNAGIIVDMGVIVFPQWIRASERAYSRSQGPHRVVQKHKTSN